MMRHLEIKGPQKRREVELTCQSSIPGKHLKAMPRPRPILHLRLLLVVLCPWTGISDAAEPSAGQLQKGAPFPGMVYIPGGTFQMGTTSGRTPEGPVHEVTVGPFWMDQYEVTVEEFARFVGATGHVTVAEQAGISKRFDVASGQWEDVKGTDWRHPDGPDSVARPREPVTQVSWQDAVAYSLWAVKRLPTEAEWEFAARGGLEQAQYPWGDELRPDGRFMANWWQGSFPSENLKTDGYAGRAPVGQFPANGYGLHDMTCNVWEWCADWYAPDYFAHSPKVNPTGPDAGEKRIVRGGSFLCSENYCTGFRVAARNCHVPETGLNNIGFRCVRKAD